MKKTFSRSLAVLLSLIILLQAVPTVADDGIAELEWSFSEGVLTVSGKGDMQNWNSYYDTPWYEYTDSITKVVITDGITTVGNNAFQDCYSLAEVILPEGITVIGDRAFCYCYALEKINLPSTLKKLNIHCFAECDSLKEITLPEGLEEIGPGAFSSAELTNIYIPDSVTIIGNEAFNNCRELQTVKLSENITVLGEKVFNDCSSLLEITIPDKVESIGNECFRHCDKLSAVNFGKAVTEIGQGTFDGCGTLTEIVLPDAVTVIGFRTFAYCYELSNITLGDNIEEIGGHAFEYTYSLKEISLPQGLKMIGDYAFYRSGLESIILPDSVTEAGMGAFSTCESLKEAVISRGLTWLPDFGYCTSLESLTVYDNTTDASIYDLEGCDKLTVYTVPSSYMWDFCIEYGIPVESIFGNRSISLSVIGDGVLTEGYTVNWYNKGSDKVIATGNILNNASDDAEYEYEIILGEELSFLYKQPERAVASSSNISHPLEAHKKITLSGNITDKGGNALSNAEISFTQTYNGIYTKTLSAYCDSKGSFAVTLDSVPTEAIVICDGYYNRDITVNTNTDAYRKIVLNPLPEGKITFTLSVQEAAYENKKALRIPLTDIRDIHFTLKNITQNRDITDFTVQYPYIITNDISEGDKLEITAADTTGTKSSATQTITVSADKSAYAELVLLEKGCFSVSEITGSDLTTVMVFDADGSFVYTDTAYSSYNSRSLPEGEYSLVFIRKTPLLRSVSFLKELDKIGLIANSDYTFINVLIRDGKILELENVSVPELDEEALYYTVPDSTYVTLSDVEIIPGQYTKLRIEYEIDKKYNTSNQKLLIALGDLEVISGGVCLDGRVCPYSINNGAVTVNTSKRKAVVYLYLTGTVAGEYSLAPKLEISIDKDNITQTLGGVTLRVTEAEINLPEKTGSKSILISGITAPMADIVIYDNGTKIATAKSNSLGDWSVYAELYKPYSYSKHSIYAYITSDLFPAPITTQTKTLTYITDFVDISTITMINTGDNGENVCVFDFNNPGATPHYRFYPGRYPTFTFKVEANADPERITDMFVYTVDTSGDTTYVRCEYDPISSLWLGTHDYSSASDAPISIGATYNGVFTDIEALIDMEIVEDIEADYTEEYNALRNELSAGISVDKSAYEAMSTTSLSDVMEQMENEGEELLDEYDYISNTSTVDSGIEISADDDSATVKSDEFTADVKLDENTKEPSELINEGYDKTPANDGTDIYVRKDDDSIDVVLPQKNIEVSIDITLTDELLDPKGDTEYEKLCNMIETAYGVSNDLVSAGNHYALALNGTEEYLSGTLKRLTELDAKNTVAMNVYLDKINELRATGAPDSEIQKLMDIRTHHNVRQSRITNGINKRTAQLAVLRNLDSIGRFLGGVGLIFDIATVKEYASQLEILRKSLPMSCPDDRAELANIERDINALLVAMIGHVGGSMAMNVIAITASFTGAAVFAPATGGGSIYVASAVVGTMLTITTATDIAFAANIENSYRNLAERIDLLDCNGDGMGDGYFGNQYGNGFGGNGFGNPSPSFDITPIIDPSGYVYEAVPSNRVEGVGATAYYVENGEEILWNAESYGQQNPLYTDKNGMFAWDVPFGEWLVRFTKDGYYDTDSKSDPCANENGYLPVPPPQLEVNTAIVSKAASTVEAVNVYADEIQIIFSQYMQIDTVNNDNITVSHNGNGIKGKISAVNAEYNYDKTAEYASVFSFIPDAALSDSVTVEISGVKNYNGLKMADSFTATEPVTLKPESVSVTEKVTVLYGSIHTLEIQILPEEAGAGKVITLSNSSPSIIGIESNSVITDENGKATVNIEGKLPGNGEITTCLDGTLLSASVFVDVATEQTDIQTCEAVESNIKSGSKVKKGTELIFTTDTEGAEIYYTLDGTCPCVVDSPSRIKYTGPISIDEDMFIIAYAVKEGYKDSPTQGFVYTVEWENPFTDVKKSHWFYKSIETVVSKGYMVGMSESKFSPNSLLTREQFVQILFAMEGMNKADYTGNTGFSDAPSGRWYSPAVKWAKQEGISSGMGNGKFGIGGKITREQLAMFMQNYAEYKNRNTDGRADISAYEDVAKVSGWAKQAVEWAVYEGIFQSTSDTKLRLDPRAVATRAVVARVVCVYDELINN